MDTVVVYYAPQACSRVTLVALEEIGLSYEARSVDFSSKMQQADAYLSINPNAEVPALLIDGCVLTQNAAILYYLNSRYPDVDLLPNAGATAYVNGTLQDLVWCSVALHIARRQVLNPGRFSLGDLDQVRARGLEYWRKLLAIIETRLSNSPWWYGERWSILDVYLNWGYDTINLAREHSIVDSSLIADFDFGRYYPAIAEHQKRVVNHPAFVRALAREKLGASTWAS